jgi:uncharacterized membrane protein YhaH (DUF805 family)
MQARKTKMNICPTCNAENASDAHYCSQCGNDISTNTISNVDKSSEWLTKTPDSDTGIKQDIIGSLFSFRGRIKRSKFWAILITLWATWAIFFGLSYFAGNSQYVEIGFSMLFFLILSNWIAYVTCVKRLHDLNMTGWLALLLLIPYFNLLVILYLGIAPGTSSFNLYGAVPGSKEDSLDNKISAGKQKNIYDSFNKSVVLLKSGNAEKALFLLEDAAKSAVNNEEKGAIYYNTAVAHRRLGNHDQSIEYLLNSIKLRPMLAKEAEKDTDLSDLYCSDEFKRLYKQL